MQANFVLVIFVYYTSQSSEGDMKVFMYFIQMAILFAGADFQWAEWLKIFNFNLVASAGASTCILPIEDHERMKMGTCVRV